MGLLLLAGSATPASASNAGGAAAPSGSPPPPQSQPAPASGTPTQAGGQGPGGSAFGETPITLPQLVVPGSQAKIIHGLAAAPAGAPPAVQQAIWTANAIVGMPYVYGGGHQAFAASGYDCSGTVSYALHGARLLSSPLDSSEFESWGVPGRGVWISVYANPGHAFVTIAGIRLDTSAAGDRSGLPGPRWRPLRHSNRGYRVVHPLNL